MKVAPLSSNNILFPALDKRRYIPIDIAGEDDERHVNLHDDTFFFATANIGSSYSGTNNIDRALLDRFYPIEMSYPKEDAEVRILQLKTGVSEKEARAIVKTAGTIRNLQSQDELSNSVSVRHTLQTAGLVADGFQLKKSIEMTFLPLFENGIGANEREKVLAAISAF